MIPEWLLFLNKSRSRMNIVLHSHVKIESLSLWRSISPCLVALDKIRMRHSPQTTRFASFNPERSVFSVYYKISVYIIPKRKFHSDWRPDWTHSGMTCTGTKSLLGIMWTDAKKIYVDGMNLLRNESYSGIMERASKVCRLMDLYSPSK